MADEKIVVEIDFDNKKAKGSFKQIEKTAKKTGKKAGDNLQKGISKGFGGLKTQILAVGAAIVTAFAGGKAIAAAVQQQDAINQLNTALKLSGQFSEELVERAWVRSDGKCECELTGHGHTGKHNAMILKSSRGRDSSYGWEAHSVSGSHLDILADCKIFCWNPCHKATL